MDKITIKMDKNGIKAVNNQSKPNFTHIIAIKMDKNGIKAVNNQVKAFCFGSRTFRYSTNDLERIMVENRGITVYELLKCLISMLV